MRTSFVAALAASVFACGIAQAAQCNIVGTWTDNYGVTGTFTSQTTGTATDTTYCPNTYTIKVTKLTTKVWDLKGTAKSCPTVKAALKFKAGSCTSASGTITVDGFQLSDTWTKTGAARRRIDTTSSLMNGLR